MGLTKDQRIKFAIGFLESNGYKVHQDFSSLIGKWAVFRQNGMKPLLHGKVVDFYYNSGMCRIKCKNAYYRYIRPDEIIDFYDNKDDCYAVR